MEGAGKTNQDQKAEVRVSGVRSQKDKERAQPPSLKLWRSKRRKGGKRSKKSGVRGQRSVARRRQKIDVGNQASEDSDHPS